MHITRSALLYGIGNDRCGDFRVPTPRTVNMILDSTFQSRRRTTFHGRMHETPLTGTTREHASMPSIMPSRVTETVLSGLQCSLDGTMRLREDQVVHGCRAQDRRSSYDRRCYSTAGHATTRCRPGCTAKTTRCTARHRRQQCWTCQRQACCAQRHSGRRVRGNCSCRSDCHRRRCVPTRESRQRQKAEREPRANPSAHPDGPIAADAARDRDRLKLATEEPRCEGNRWR